MEMTIKRINSETYFLVTADGKKYDVFRYENFRTGSIEYRVQHSRPFFSYVSPKSPLFRQIVDRIEFRPTSQ